MDPCSALALRPTHPHFTRRPGGFGGGPHMHNPPAYMGMSPMGSMPLGGGGLDPYRLTSSFYGPSIPMDPFAGLPALNLLGGGGAGGFPRSRRHYYYSDLLGDYGGGGGSSRYSYPADMFDDIFDDDLFLDDYDDIQDPLLLWLKLQRGGGRRGGRRGRYGRYGGGSDRFW